MGLIYLTCKTLHLCDSARVPQMGARPSEKALIDVCLTQKKLNVLLGPIPRW